MRVFGRALVLGCLATVVCPPVAAKAAPLLIDSSGQPDDGEACSDVLNDIGASECSWFAVLDPYAALSVTGEFDTSVDMALFSFTFTETTRLQIETSSFGELGSFDPTLALYDSNGTILRVLDPAGSGQLVTANQFDISLDLQDYDDRIDVVLEADQVYLLALVTGFAYESLETPFDGGDLSRGSTFSFTFNAAPEVDGPAPVPEPGTLTLMAGGAIAGLLQRRRTRKRQGPSSSVSG